MFFINLIIILFFKTLVNTSSLTDSKYWYFTCSSNECTAAINSCLNCVGERMCKGCITNISPNCSTCASDIFNKEDLENIDGVEYFTCENADPFQSKVCHFYCRGQFSQFGQCEIQQNIPLCKCSTLTTTTPMYNKPKVEIYTNSIEKVFQLKNGDLVRGSRGFGSNIQIYDSNTGLIKRNLTSSYFYPWAFGQLSNGYLVACYYTNKTILIWDLTTSNEPLTKIFQTNEVLFSLTVLKNDDLVISQGADQSASSFNSDIVIRNSQDGSIKNTLVGHTNTVYQIIELSNGNLVSCSWDKTVRIWNLSLSTKLVKTILHSNGVQSITFLKNGNLVSGLNDGRIEIRDFETTNLIRTLYGHSERICFINCLHVLENGDLLSASHDKSIKVWDPYDSRLKLTNNKHVSIIRQLGFLPNKNMFSVSDSEIFIW